jgi:hypothetical protein
MNIRCLLRGHPWGPPEGVGRGLAQRCRHCGKTKAVGGGPAPEGPAPAPGYPGHSPNPSSRLRDS